MGRELNECASYFIPKVIQLEANCLAIGIPLYRIDTGRSVAQQKEKLAQNVSWTKYSKHEPQQPEGKSEAADEVPEAILKENKPNWDPTNPLWLKIGLEGEKLGLEWGGRWREHPDPSHFEYIHDETNRTAHDIVHVNDMSPFVPDPKVVEKDTGKK